MKMRKTDLKIKMIIKKESVLQMILILLIFLINIKQIKILKKENWNQILCQKKTLEMKKMNVKMITIAKNPIIRDNNKRMIENKISIELKIEEKLIL